MASFLFRLIRVLIVLFIAGGLAFALFAAREKPEKKEVVLTPPGVRVILVQPKTQTMTVEAFGTVVPRKKVNIAAEVPGRIDYIHPLFREGGLIKKGDVLIRIDQRSFTLDKQAAQVRVNQARADIKQLTQEIVNLKSDVDLAQMNQNLSLKELERMRTLSENQFASITSLDKAEQQHLAAKIQLQSATNRLALTPTLMVQKKAGLAMAQTDHEKTALILEKSEIKAGFSGFVLTKQVEMGEYVNPGQILGAIYQGGALDVDVRIPLEQLKWIQSFFKNNEMPEALVEMANFQGENAPVWKAKVVRIKANIDEKTRTLPMTLEIYNSPDSQVNTLLDLKPGTFVKCRIMGETHENIFVLPRHLLKSGDTLFVAVKDDLGKDHLEIRQIQVLRKFEDDVYISHGLSQGESIVSSPLPGAIDGMALTVKAAGQ